MDWHVVYLYKGHKEKPCTLVNLFTESKFKNLRNLNKLHAKDPYREMKAPADSAQRVLGQDRLPSVAHRV